MKFVIWDFYLHIIIKYIYPFLVESIVKKFLINMTKKDLLEAIEDMPMDAKIEFYHYNVGYANIYKAYYNEELNRIELC